MRAMGSSSASLLRREFAIRPPTPNDLTRIL
jgi:hypothetical protein